jgi:hypothetical protein
MIKRLTYILVVAIFLLTACQSAQAVPTTTPGETKAPEPAVAASPTAAASPTETLIPTATLEIVAGETMPGCVVQTMSPTPEPTLQALFPLPGEKDWVEGPDTAYVTIYEYSDFQ